MAMPHERCRHPHFCCVCAGCCMVSTKKVGLSCNRRPRPPTCYLKQVMIWAGYRLITGVIKMCSEELRLDLESFINKGLSKGLRGWPVKEEERPAAENGSQRYGQLAMLGFACHLREGPAACRFEPNPPRRVASPPLY